MISGRAPGDRGFPPWLKQWGGGIYLREHDGLTWFYLQCILTEAAKHTCKLACEPQRIDEKDFSKTSLLQRGRKNESMKENGETQGKQNNTKQLLWF